MKHILLILLYLASFLVAIYFSYQQGYDDAVIDTMPLWSKEGEFLKTLADSSLLDNFDFIMVGEKSFQKKEIKTLNNIFRHRLLEDKWTG